MGTSTDAILVFGVPVGGEEDGDTMPWEEKFEGDPDEWLLALSDWQPLHTLYTEDGKDYAPGITKDDPRIKEHYAHKRAWKTDHPSQVALVRHCHSDYPMWILAVPGTELRAYRGHPKDIAELRTPDPEKVAALVDFLREHFPDKAGQQPRWILCSDWG